MRPPRPVPRMNVLTPEEQLIAGRLATADKAANGNLVISFKNEPNLDKCFTGAALKSFLHKRLGDPAVVIMEQDDEIQISAGNSNMLNELVRRAQKLAGALREK